MKTGHTLILKMLTGVKAMNDSTNTRLHKIATFLINNLYGIVALFLAITIGMMFAMSQLRIETGFKKQR